MKLSLSNAAREVGLNKTTVYRAIKNGRLSAEFVDGVYLIDPAELFRVFKPANEKSATPTETDKSNNSQRGGAVVAMSEALAELRGRVETLTAWNADLKTELAAEREERRRLTLMLTDQRTNTRDADHQASLKGVAANNWPLVVLSALLVFVCVAAIIAMRLGWV
jgi:hypothetical protein